MRLKNKIAIITGGGTGIGLACARLFCQEGARVALFGRRSDRLEQAVDELGESAIAVAGDISGKEDIDRLVGQALETWGRVDILVNSAGTYGGSPVHETSDGDWDRVMNVNMGGVFKLTRRVLPVMVQQNSGSIVHISSILGLVAAPEVSAYAASKAALIQFSRCVAAEYGGRGIRSNAVCPGLIETEMTAELMADKDLMREWSKNYPIGRFGVPVDVAACCLFLAGDEASFITGATVPVDGGYTAL